MHRQVLGVTDPKTKVDHRDGDGLNNCRSNLRRSTHQQNMYNQRKHGLNTSSRFKGVNIFKSQWQSRITANGLRIFLGYFPTEEQAAKAYNRAALRYHKSFALLNEV